MWVYQEGEKLVAYWCMPLFLSLILFFDFCVFLFFSLLFFLIPPLFLFVVMIPFFSDEPLLFIATILYIVSDDGIFHFFTLQPLLAPYGCPSKTTHWLAGCLATTIALNVLAAPLLIPKQNGLSCFLPSSVLTTLIWIRIKPFPHLRLWHASSGSNSFLLLLGEMPS